MPTSGYPLLLAVGFWRFRFVADRIDLDPVNGEHLDLSAVLAFVQEVDSNLID